MQPQTAKKVIASRFRKLERYSSRMCDPVNVEDIHLFRVEVKKLRAFLELLQQAHDRKLKIPRSLKRIYKTAGNVRDLQIRLQSLKEENVKEHSANHKKTENELSEAVKNLRRSLNPRSLQQAHAVIKGKITNRLKNSTIRAFYNEKFTAIHQIISAAPLSDEQLHLVRKDIKNLLYNAKIFGADVTRPFPLADWNQEKEATYTDLAGKLGRYHDYCVELSYYGKNKLGLTTKEKQHVKDIQAKELDLKSEIINLLHVADKQFIDRRSYRRGSGKTLTSVIAPGFPGT